MDHNKLEMKSMRKSVRGKNSKVNSDSHVAPLDIINSDYSDQGSMQSRRSFWKSFSNIFKCSTKRRHIPVEPNLPEASNLVTIQKLETIPEEPNISNDTDGIRENIEDMKILLKKYSISPNGISTIQRIEYIMDSQNDQNVLRQASLSGYLADVSSSSEDEESATKRVQLKNKINELRQETVRDDSNRISEVSVAEKTKVLEKQPDTSIVVKQCDASSSSVDKDTYSFEYSESESLVDVREDREEKVMFNNNVIAKDENDVITINHLNTDNQDVQTREHAEGTCVETGTQDNSDTSRREENDRMKTRRQMERMQFLQGSNAMVDNFDEQYNVALTTLDTIEKELISCSKQMDTVKSINEHAASEEPNKTKRISEPRTKEHSEETAHSENKVSNDDGVQRERAESIKIFGAKIMDNQGSSLLRHLHDLHQKQPENIESSATSLDDSLTKTRALNVPLDMPSMYHSDSECTYDTVGWRSPQLFDDDDDEDSIAENTRLTDADTNGTQTNSSESLDELEVWSRVINVHLADPSIVDTLDDCPVNEDGLKEMRLNDLFKMYLDPSSYEFRVYYEPILKQGERAQRTSRHFLHGRCEENGVTRKQKLMSLIQHITMDEDSLKSADNDIEDDTAQSEEQLEDSPQQQVDEGDGSEEILEKYTSPSISSLTYTSFCAAAASHSPTELSEPLSGKDSVGDNALLKRTEHVTGSYSSHRNDTGRGHRRPSRTLQLATRDLMKFKGYTESSSENLMLGAVDDSRCNNRHIEPICKALFRTTNDTLTSMLNEVLIDVAELKDDCVRCGATGSDEPPLVTFKQICNGDCIDMSDRITQAIVQVNLDDILDMVFDQVEASTGRVEDDKCATESNVLSDIVVDKSKIFKIIDEDLVNMMQALMIDVPQWENECVVKRSKELNAEHMVEGTPPCNVDTGSLKLAPDDVIYTTEEHLDKFAVNSFKLLDRTNVLFAEQVLAISRINEDIDKINILGARNNHQNTDASIDGISKCTQSSDTLRETPNLMCNYQNLYKNKFAVKSGNLCTATSVDSEQSNRTESVPGTSVESSNFQAILAEHLLSMDCDRSNTSNKGKNPLVAMYARELSRHNADTLKSIEFSADLANNSRISQLIRKKLAAINRQTTEILKSTGGLASTISALAAVTAETATTSYGNELSAETLRKSEQTLTENVTSLSPNRTGLDSSARETDLTGKCQNFIDSSDSYRKIIRTYQDWLAASEKFTEILERILSKCPEQCSECVQEDADVN